MPQSLEPDHLARLQSYARGVLTKYQNAFSGASDRFADGQRLLARFQTATNNVIANGGVDFALVDEAHNEVCIAEALLSDPTLALTRLRYEPTLPNTAKTIDFVAEVAEAQGRALLFVDVKTICPLPTDRWDQYERAAQEGWLGDAQYDLDQRFLGGELWHNAFASRGRMLEYTIELEQKIAAANIARPESQFILALCGTGFEWEKHELEDFVAFYRTGRHRSDDTFAPTERNYLEKNALRLSRTITTFACMHRPRGSVSPTQIYVFKPAAAKRC